MFVVVILRTCFHGMFPFHCGMFLHPSGIKDGEVTSKILAPTNPRRLHNPERTPTHLPIPSELKCLPFWLSILFSSPQRVLVCMAHLCGLNVFRWHEASPPTLHVEVNCSSDVENVKHNLPRRQLTTTTGCALLCPLPPASVVAEFVAAIVVAAFVVATFVVAAFIVAAFIVVCCCSVHCCLLLQRLSLQRSLLQHLLLFVVAAFVVAFQCCRSPNKIASLFLHHWSL